MHTSLSTRTDVGFGRRSASRWMLAATLLAACDIKGPGFFEPLTVDAALLRACTLTTSAFAGVPASMNVGDAASGQFTSSALSVLGGCDARRATYTFTSSNPAVATVAQTAGSTPTQSSGVFVAPITLVPVGAGSATLTGTITLDDGKTSTASIPVTVVRPVGSLAITISGLPSGTAADVTVTQGTTAAGRLTATGTLTQLGTGGYTITAANVTSADGTVYEATPTSQQITVGNQATATASVLYTPQVGALRVTLDGLPLGATASVTVARGTTTVRTVTASTVIQGLNIGAYVLTANPVAFGGVNYAPTPTTRTITVARGAEVSAQFSYVATTGRLSVTVSGLPSGANADVRVSLGNTLVGNATAITTTFDNLAPGTYMVAASSVSSAGVTYVPSPATQSVTVTASSTPATASVSYAPAVLPPRITLSVTGLPAGGTPQVTITGPGFTRTLNTTGPVTVDLPSAGTYTVTAARLMASPTELYDPDQTTRQVVVAAQQNLAVTMSYTRLSAVEYRVTGLPANAGDPTGRITNGIDTYAFNASGTTYLRPGTYNVTIDPVALANALFRPLTPVQRIVVGNSAALVITYAYYLAEVQYLLSAQTGIFSDLLGHRLFVNMFVTAVLRAVLTNPPPAAAASPAPSIAMADPATLTITGPAPWITVSGTRADDGTIVLTGSGSAAGFSGVPARLTGVFTGTGNITGGRLQFGQATPPTGLPNGPIIYTLTATGAPASAATSFDGYLQQQVPKRVPTRVPERVLERVTTSTRP